MVQAFNASTQEVEAEAGVSESVSFRTGTGWSTKKDAGQPGY